MQATLPIGRKVYCNSDMRQVAFDSGLNMQGTITQVDIIGEFVDYEVTWSDGEAQWLHWGEFSVPTA